MNRISTFFSRYWRNVHFVTIALVAMVFVYGEPIINSRTSNVLLTVFNYPFFKLRTTAVGLYEVGQENERLTAALVSASVQLTMLEEDRLENQRLRKALKFEPPPAYTMLPAKIVALSPGRVAITAVINKGSSDSVEINQPVINESGLIGRIIEVRPDFATVQLLTDPANRIASRVQRSRDMGIAKYQRGEGMILDNFPVRGEIVVGDLIISSGLGQVYPSGLTIGTVTSVQRGPEAVFCKVTLKTSADFARLDELFVLRPELVTPALVGPEIE